MTYIESYHINARLNESHAEILQSFRERKQCNYELLLLAFKFARRELQTVKRKFDSSFDKLRYILAIAKKHIPEAQEELNRRKWNREQVQHIDLSVNENKVWNFRGTGAPVDANTRALEDDEEIKRFNREMSEEIDIEALW